VPGDARGPAPPGTGTPTAPRHRPTWLVVLSSLALMYGGLLLVSGLSALRDPQAAARLPVARPLPADEEAFSRKLVEAGAQVVATHARAIRGRAAASVLLALLLLYGAAAALARDRHGRAVTLAAAWTGIAYQLMSLPVIIPMVRDYARASAPLLAAMVVADRGGGAEAPSPEAVTGLVQSLMIGIPLVTAAVGIAGSIVLIAYFGGRRGRTLYGLAPPGARPLRGPR
jgi:hypothetical protein